MKNIINFLIIIFIALNLIGIFRDTGAMQTKLRNDFMIRVHATDFLQNGKNPYLMIPYSLTVTPLVITFGLPLTNTSHFLQSYIWYFLEWVMLISIYFMFTYAEKNKLKRKIILLIFLTISITIVWRWHIETGQIYVLYAFLVTLTLKLKNYLAGFLMGMATALRPPFLLFPITMFVYKKYKFLIGYFGGLILGIILPTLIQKDIWISYFNSMLMQAGLQLKSVVATTLTACYKTVSFVALNSSLQSVFKYYMEINLPVLSLFFMFGAIVLFILYYLNYKKIILKTNDIVMLTYSLILVSEFFLPSPRYFYYDIQWLVIIAYSITQMPLEKFLKSKLNLIWILIAIAYSISIAASYLLAIYTLCLFYLSRLKLNHANRYSNNSKS